MKEMNYRLLRQKEVAEMIGMSEAWLEQCRFRRKGINFIKVGRSVRYRLSEVEAYIQGQVTICE